MRPKKCQLHGLKTHLLKLQEELSVMLMSRKQRLNGKQKAVKQLLSCPSSLIILFMFSRLPPGVSAGFVNCSGIISELRNEPQGFQMMRVCVMRVMIQLSFVFVWIKIIFNVQIRYIRRIHPA